MLNKISFYGYLFHKSVDKIILYDILWKNKDKYLLKYTLLDRNYKNPTDEIIVMVYDSLSKCIAAIIGRLRNHEVEMGVYKNLKTVIKLDEIYQPLLSEIEETVLTNGAKSFSFFGHICKYKPQTLAKEFLKSMGYFTITSKRPHIYVLDEFVKKELKSVMH
jgi:hypothetical protein